MFCIHKINIHKIYFTVNDLRSHNTAIFRLWIIDLLEKTRFQIHQFKYEMVDMDSLGYINNAVYLNYIDCTSRFFSKLKFLT